MAHPRRATRTDPVLLLEVALGLTMIALFVWLFWIPASQGPFVPRWWAGWLLAGMFFGIVGLDAWRRRRRRSLELRETLEEVREQAASGDGMPL